ncbi:hypothetical protein ACFL0X_00280 [Nanoarchaeota archaeon]
MAKKKVKKKSVKKKISRKNKPKRKVKKVSSRARKKVVSNKTRSGKRKFKLIFRNLIIFGVLFILSLVAYMATGNEVYENLFFLLILIFGFVEVAFLIVLLVLFFLKLMKR